MGDDKKPNGKRAPFERTMMRCTRPECRRWITVAPGESRMCPNCAVLGISIAISPVDHQAHMASLPVREDSSDDIAKLAAQTEAKSSKS